VTFFDCLHYMGDPVGAAAHVCSTLKKDGTWMIVEPAAGDKLEDNINPVGRAFYGHQLFSALQLHFPRKLDSRLGRKPEQNGCMMWYRREALRSFAVQPRLPLI
jgi:hypothetical protein